MPRSARAAAVLIVVLALLLSLPFVGGDYYVYLFALVFINVILSASLRPSLTCGQLNIGHSAFMCIGAYTSALLAKNLGVPFEVSLLGGAVLAAAVGLAIGYPSLRLRGVYFAMVTVAFVEAIRLNLGAADPWQCRLERSPQAHALGNDAGHQDKSVLPGPLPDAGRPPRPLQTGAQPPRPHLEEHRHG